MFRWLWKFVYIYNNFDQTRISNLYFVEVENSTSQNSEYVLQRKLGGWYLTLKNSLLKISKEAGMLIWVSCLNFLTGLFSMYVFSFMQRKDTFP